MIKQFNEIYPEREHGIVYRNPNTFFGYNAWPTVAIDEKGVLYAVCSGFRVGHVCPFGKTLMFKSFDMGKTWSIPMVINDTYLDDRDAGIVALGDNKLLVTWFTHSVQCYQETERRWIKQDWPASDAVVENAYPTIPAELSNGGSYVRVSQDGGMTWGETVRIPISAPHGPTLRKDGSLLYLGTNMYSIESDDVGEDGVWAFESRDEGKTWKKIGKVPTESDWSSPCEPHVIELANGRLLGMIRIWHPEVELTNYITFSDDGGITWEKPRPLGTNGAPPHLMCHSSGVIVLTYGRRVAPFGQRALISRDNGETWEDEYILRDDANNWDLGYPSTVELPDGSLLSVYYQIVEGDKLTSIQYTHWHL